MCGLTTTINVSQKKYRVSQISPVFIIVMSAQITFISRLDTRALRKTILFPFLSLFHFILPNIKNPHVSS